MICGSPAIEAPYLRSMQMEASLKRELQTASEEKEKFVNEFSEEDYDYIVTGWQVRRQWIDLVVTQQLQVDLSLRYCG